MLWYFTCLYNYLFIDIWFNNYIIVGFLLELAANDDINSRVNGAVKQVTGGIPFDYNETHSHLFTAKALRDQIDDMHKKGTFTDQGESNKHNIRNL